MSKTPKIWALPLMLIAAVLVCLAMLRLGVWQLDRAAQKRVILQDSQQRASQPALDFARLISDLSGQDQTPNSLRFRQVVARGHYLPQSTLFLDNQVSNSRPGYAVVTPFQAGQHILLVNRGWLASGESRANLPVIETPEGQLSLRGQLNNPTSKPPMWNDRFTVQDGARWQYLDLPLVQKHFELSVFPLMLELAPDQADAGGFERAWSKPDEQWVARHQAYALQWFAMALAFFIACLVLLAHKHKHQKNDDTTH